ncbi:hypothetical protein DRW07_03490 [Alteromonas sediminis]|uniref:Uncharacterized protein n=1 Tax=Alteromonas sediminis TaxID=2259342 RepID=A0A3N5YQL6_9ALTE|nr:hypothetical protein [Alteromonas sediminis]RPJ68481.1 hypothetical protein DRW07_03490 [Alteromonas sediminis]
MARLATRLSPVLCIAGYLSILGAAHADSTLQSQIEHAVLQFEQTPIQNWSYRVERYENEEGDITQFTELYQPAKDADMRWSLLTINGMTPSEKQHLRYKKDKNNADNHGVALKLRELIVLESLQLQSETAHTYTANFDVMLEKLGEDASQQLTGQLIYDKQAAFISTIEITNVAPFSPVMTAKIADFKLSLHFKKVGDAVLASQQNMSMTGTFAFFTEINEVSTDTFSHYVYVGETATP